MHPVRNSLPYSDLSLSIYSMMAILRSPISLPPSFLLTLSPLPALQATGKRVSWRPSILHTIHAYLPASKEVRKMEYFFNVCRNGVSVLNTTYAPQPGHAGVVGDFPLSLWAARVLLCPAKTRLTRWLCIVMLMSQINRHLAATLNPVLLPTIT